MKTKTVFFCLFICAAMTLTSCGKCMQCLKSEKPSLSYCEGDFPDKNKYQEQIEALEALGYTCSSK